VLGCGSVSQCTLPLLLDEIDVPPRRVTVMDMVDNRARVRDVLKRGIKYVVDQITPENLDATLSKHLSAGDLLVDLAWNIDACTIVQWCHDHGVLYLNTSVELWDPYAGGADRPPLERTLYVRHMALRRMAAKWRSADRGATAVVEHGANPGLVSHFTKVALDEITATVLRDRRIAARRRRALESAHGAGDYASLAMHLGVKVIHISERDTQIATVPKRVNEFVNTWSVEGFYEEGIAPAELGWGTHEKWLPPGTHVHAGKPGNQICLARPGMKTWVRSWVPEGEITGMVVRHGEAFTISDHLTVWDDAGGAPRYRPTVHYAYCPADVAINSVHELEMRQWDLQSEQRILNDEIVSGQDQLGVLLMGHDLTAWWTGSLLSIDETRAIVPGQNATTLQVAASVLAAARWMIRHPDRGLRVPDDLPHDEIMAVARPYLGSWFSGAVDWDPLRSRVDPFLGWNDAGLDRRDPWQFRNFLL
jgi:homospermidine synthase